jgi:hypothetical protein
LRDGHWPPPRLLLRMMLALYQSARGRANAARACWWLGKAVPQELSEAAAGQDHRCVSPDGSLAIAPLAGP